MSRPSLRALVENWRRWPGARGERWRLTLRNALRRFRSGEACCGHPGEPGC